MNRILLNADIGERGHDHPGDRELIGFLDLANIACGGHAGDAQSIAVFRTLAEKRGVLVAAHLSYPDPANFGRLSVSMPVDALLAALSAQLASLPGVSRVKFHGALYHDACRNSALAGHLCQWLAAAGVTEVITLADGELARHCRDAGLEVWREAFAERRYGFSQADGRLALLSRTHPQASITQLGEALAQVRDLVERGKVRAFLETGDSASPPGSGSSLPRIGEFPIVADTICIHSDSPIALELAPEAARLLRGGGRPEAGG